MCNHHHEKFLIKVHRKTKKCFAKKFILLNFFIRPHTTPDSHTAFPSEENPVQCASWKNYFVCVSFLWKKFERERGEGCAIDFLFSSRTNNILWLALAPNMKWKSTKLWNIFFPSSDRTCVVTISLFIVRFLHVLFPSAVWDVHLWVRVMISVSHEIWRLRARLFTSSNLQLYAIKYVFKTNIMRRI